MSETHQQQHVFMLAGVGVEGHCEGAVNDATTNLNVCMGGGGDVR